MNFLFQWISKFLNAKRKDNQNNFLWKWIFKKLSSFNSYLIASFARRIRNMWKNKTILWQKCNSLHTIRSKFYFDIHQKIIQRIRKIIVQYLISILYMWRFWMKFDRKESQDIDDNIDNVILHMTIQMISDMIVFKMLSFLSLLERYYESDHFKIQNMKTSVIEIEYGFIYLIDIILRALFIITDDSRWFEYKNWNSCEIEVDFRLIQKSCQSS